MFEQVAWGISRLDADFHLNVVGTFIGIGAQGGFFDCGGLFFKVLGKFGIKIEFKILLMGGEKIECFCGVSKPPPVTVRTIAEEIPTSEQAKGFFIIRMLGGRENNSEVFGGAFNFDFGAIVFGD
jgi:hypothetical protein